jgi:Leucine-rich repeat (LRR) protein
VLNLGLNNLGDNSTKHLEFLKSLTNCSKLQIISITNNNFGGNLPNFIGNLSTQLTKLFIGGNQISGKIPA